MANENRPVIYTITIPADNKVRIYTKDTRVSEGNRDITYDASKVPLTGWLTFITGTLNKQGFAVLFEMD